MFICEIWLNDWYFPQFCKYDMSKYGYLEMFQRVPLTSRYSTDIVFLCRFSVWGVFPRRFRLVWQTVFLRFRLHRFVPFSKRKSVCVTDQSKAVTRRFLSLQKTSFTHAQILQTKTAFAETLFRQEPIRFTQFYMS